MIKYTLRCAEDHRFESWFASADAFDRLAKAGRLSCAQCGSNNVEKAMMSPRVRPGRKKVDPPQVEAPPPSPSAASRPLATPGTELEAKLAALKRHVEENSDYVGKSFAKEARAIHDGEAPARAIYGEANGAEVKSLVEDGVPVLPLPFTPQRKVN